MTVTAVSFDGTSLTNPSPPKLMVSGATDSWEISFDCVTDTFADITALQAKAGRVNKSTLYSGKVSVQGTGTKGTLAITGGSLNGNYTNCYIDGDIAYEEIGGTGGGLWKYSPKFVKDCGS